MRYRGENLVENSLNEGYRERRLEIALAGLASDDWIARRSKQIQEWVVGTIGYSTMVAEEQEANDEWTIVYRLLCFKRLII
jgi:hypothetical protein